MPEKAAGILGIEGGGTKTRWALLTSKGKILAQGTAGPGNTLLLDDVALRRLLQDIRRGAGSQPVSIGAAFAGCQQPAEQIRVERALRTVWPKAGIVRVMEDTRSVLAAAFGEGSGIVVIGGTGSNVAAQKTASAPIEKAVGWGHLVGDRGSAYDLVRRGLEDVYDVYDRTRVVSPLGQEFLLAAGRSTLEELVPALMKDTGKTAVASLAWCVFSASDKGDSRAAALIEAAAGELAEKVSILAARLGDKEPRVALVGGLFENQPRYVSAFRQHLLRFVPNASAFILAVPGVLGAARLAGLESVAPATELPTAAKPIAEPARLAAFAQAATEQRNPRSRGLDKRSIPQLVDLFIREERYVEKALTAQRRTIAAAASLVAKKLAAGGRLFYVGAGTSGRLGVVDASEMPPTYNAPPDQVQAIIAGGPPAVFRSQEGAEDSGTAGADELKARGLGKRDVVCGIAASGQTPFVLGALEFARRRGAGTILLTCNPQRVIRVPADVEIDLPTGPEIVTGSTRMKAGTATKLVLNILSTVAMVRLGRVRDNLMINVQATNDKLRARAVRLVEALTGMDPEKAQAALEAQRWSVSNVEQASDQNQKKSTYLDHL